MRAREPDACTSEEYHGLITAMGKTRRTLKVSVDAKALDHLLKDHARFQREAGRPET